LHYTRKSHCCLHTNYLVAAEDTGTHLLETTPKCMINFNDSVSIKTYYNSTEKLFYYNRSFENAGTYTWNITCESEEHVTKLSGTKEITVYERTPPVALNLFKLILFASLFRFTLL